jgi:hypothetical protein
MLGAAILDLLHEVEQSGGRPRILVIDSLSDGYNLGAAAPRELADALCKLAVERGMILILLEEIAEERPSVWSFVTDIGIELGRGDGTPASDGSDSFERRLTLTKNRFGASDQSTHRFSILPGFGVRALPHPRAYTFHVAESIVLAGWENLPGDQQWWNIKLQFPDSWPSFQRCVTAVYGTESHETYTVALSLGATTSAGKPLDGTEIQVNFNTLTRTILPTGVQVDEFYQINCGDPFTTGDWILSSVVQTLENLQPLRKPVRRVLCGNLQALRTFWDPQGIRRALMVLARILRRVRVPLVLFETSGPRASLPWPLDQNVVSPTVATEPAIVDFADVVLAIQPASFDQASSFTITDTQTGRRVAGVTPIMFIKPQP